MTVYSPWNCEATLFGRKPSLRLSLWNSDPHVRRTSPKPEPIILRENRDARRRQHGQAREPSLTSFRIVGARKKRSISWPPGLVALRFEVELRFQRREDV